VNSFKQPAGHSRRVFVAGHQRPDTDAAVSACVVAMLKDRLDPSLSHEPILLGEPNRQTRWVFEQAGLPLPAVRADIRPMVGETMSRQFISLSESAHLAEAVELLHRAEGSLIPVVAADGVLAGVLSDRLPQSRYFYNFNAEDYLGQLLHLPDVVSALGLARLHQIQPPELESPGCFRLAAATPDEARKEWTPLDVILCGNQPELAAVAAAQGVRAVIFADCEEREAAAIIAQHPKLAAYHFQGSLMSLVSQLPLAIPVSVIMERDFPRLSVGQLLDEVREVVAHTPHALPVVDDDGRLIGTLSKADLLNEEKRLLILVDHFESTQSVCGIEEAEILEIIDHHRVGNIETMQPVRVDCRPVGSTASIIAAQFAEAGLRPSRREAVLLLGALVSDTLLLTSPTTAPSDVALAKSLAKTARVSLREFGRDVLRQNDELATAPPDRLVEKDIKEFQHRMTRFAAGQVETVELEALTAERAEELLANLNATRRRMGADFGVLMVTDVFKGESRVFVADDNPGRAAALLGGPVNGSGRHFPGMVSRKKQLIPLLLRNLDLLAKAGARR
jgi:manganese-dependent inorganic pyrophosphatase